MLKITKILVSALALLVLFFSRTELSAQEKNRTASIVVPNPFTVGIDDLGWKQGWRWYGAKDLNKPHFINGPEGRWMGMADYKIIIDIARAVNSRLLCLLCPNLTGQISAPIIHPPQNMVRIGTTLHW